MAEWTATNRITHSAPFPRKHKLFRSGRIEPSSADGPSSAQLLLYNRLQCQPGSGRTRDVNSCQIGSRGGDQRRGHTGCTRQPGSCRCASSKGWRVLWESVPPG
jgi:hypothetical protein